MSDHKTMSKADACRVFEREGFLVAWPAEVREEWLAAGRLLTFEAGEQVSTAGDDADAGTGLYGVVAGQVAVLSGMGAPDSPTAVLFNRGSCFGYAPLFGLPRVIHVHATTSTTILSLSLREARRMLNAHPEWWQHLAHLIFLSAINASTVWTDLLMSRSDRRLAAMLLHHAGCRQAGQPYPIYLSQEEIGATARLSRHPTRQLLQAFEARGWISQSYRCINILAPRQLRTLIDSDEPLGLSS